MGKGSGKREFSRGGSAETAGFQGAHVRHSGRSASETIFSYRFFSNIPRMGMFLFVGIVVYPK